MVVLAPFVLVSVFMGVWFFYLVCLVYVWWSGKKKYSF